MKILITTLLLLIAGCSSIQQQFEPESFKKGLYRKDMKIKANGFKGHGVLVVPADKKYKMEVKAIGRLDLYTMQTCHRDITQEDAGYKGRFLGFGRDKKLAKSEFIPVEGLETDGACPIEFGGYEKKRGRHSWGAMVMESKGYTLPSVAKCNGRTTQYRGTSICQSRAGLVQRIEFPVPVEYDLDDRCKYTSVKMLDGGKIFEYRMPEGQCNLLFIEKDGEKVSEHYDYGYSKIIIEN